MRSFKLAVATTALGLALTASAALAQGPFPGGPAYPPGYPGAAPGMPPAPYPGGMPYGPMPGPYAGPMAAPMMPGGPGMPGMPGMAPPQAPYGMDPSMAPMQVPYGTDPSMANAQDPSQLYGSGAPSPSASAPGPGGFAPPPGYSPNPFAPPPDMVPGVPPLANAPGQAPMGVAAGPMAMQGPSVGPSGIASAQASPRTIAPPPPAAGGAATDTIRIVDTESGGVSIDPTPVRYPISRPITWINNSTQIVQIASDDASTFDSGPMAPGDSFTYTPTLIGTVYYRDKLHPWVRATLVSTGQ
jgi:hypothetical protein